MVRKVKFSLDDAFETKSGAMSSARDRRKAGDLVRVKKITPQDSGRLKFGLFVGDKRRKR